MTNLEYLERVKNLSGLKEFLFGTECANLEETFQIRKILALEIIAEELCKLNIREDNKFSGGEKIE